MQFTDQFLSAQAIWQNGFHEDPERRAAAGATLEEEAQKLPEEFRTVTSTCYRKRFIYKSDVKPWMFSQLDEGVASWTTDPRYVEKFKGGFRPDAMFGAIFAKDPEPAEIVLNVTALWRSDEFEAAVESYSHRNGTTSAALKHFRDLQSEIVLNTKLLPEDIYAMCAMASEFETICAQAGIGDPAVIDDTWKRLAQSGEFLNEPQWIGHAAALGVVSRSQDKILKLLDKVRPKRC